MRGPASAMMWSHSSSVKKCSNLGVGWCGRGEEGKACYTTEGVDGSYCAQELGESASILPEQAAGRHGLLAGLT